MRKIFLPLFVILTALNLHAQIVNIPDANFKNALLTHNPVIDLNGDGEIQLSEAAAFSGAMDVSYKNIIDITGIEAFVTMNHLDCSGNKIRVLPLAGLNGLLDLHCSGNLLTTLDVNLTPNLGILNCAYNQLTSLPLNNLNSLFSLDISSNQISSLSLPNPSILASLWCYNNRLTSLPSGMTSLRVLFCNNNLITTIPGGMNLLTHLDCSNNLISSLTVDNCPSLQLLRFRKNLCTSFSLSNKPLLTELICDSNQLSSLFISALPALTEIDCSGNNLSTLSLNNFPSLRHLWCRHNQLSLLQLSNLPVLVDIFSNNNRFITFSLANLPLLNFLDISNNQISSLALSNLPSFNNLGCSNNQLLQLDLSGIPIKSLYCDGNPNLSYINIRNNAVSTNPNHFYLAGLFNLQSVCVDDQESIYVNTIVNTQLPGQNVSISTFCTPTGNYNTVVGAVRFDQNANGCNNLDSTMKFVRVDISDGVQSGSTFTNYLGHYRFLTPQGPNTVTPVFPNNWFVITPSAQIVNFMGFGNTATADFCITENGIHPDLEIVLLVVGTAIPGYDATCKLVYKNKGNQFQNGTVTLSYDNNKLNFLSATPSVTSQTIGNLSWNYTGLSPYETRTIDLVFRVAIPPIANYGDTLSFTATVNPVIGDETPVDNVFNLQQTVVNSFDPNDKQVLEGARLNINKLNDFLHYLVRFQNLGTTSAIRVIVKDSLSGNMDWNTFEPIIASHPFKTVISKGNLVQFIFDGINLPPKTVNEKASNGFVSFKIKPKSNLLIGDQIQNTASIYFDFNLPIVTNKVTTTIYKPNNNTATGITIYSNPTKDFLSFSVKPGVEIKAINFYNSAGQKMNVRVTEITTTTRKLDVTNFANGIYFLEMITNLGTSSQKVVVVK